jgi:hypothetical protein
MHLRAVRRFAPIDANQQAPPSLSLAVRACSLPGLDCGGDEQERYNADVAMIFVSRPPIKVAPFL